MRRGRLGSACTQCVRAVPCSRSQTRTHNVPRVRRLVSSTKGRSSGRELAGAIATDAGVTLAHAHAVARGRWPQARARRSWALSSFSARGLVTSVRGAARAATSRHRAPVLQQRHVLPARRHLLSQDKDRTRTGKHDGRCAPLQARNAWSLDPSGLWQCASDCDVGRQYAEALEDVRRRAAQLAGYPLVERRQRLACAAQAHVDGADDTRACERFAERRSQAVVRQTVTRLAARSWCAGNSGAD